MATWCQARRRTSKAGLGVSFPFSCNIIAHEYLGTLTQLPICFLEIGPSSSSGLQSYKHDQGKAEPAPFEKPLPIIPGAFHVDYHEPDYHEPKATKQQTKRPSRSPPYSPRAQDKTDRDWASQSSSTLFERQCTPGSEASSQQKPPSVESYRVGDDEYMSSHQAWQRESNDRDKPSEATPTSNVDRRKSASNPLSPRNFYESQRIPTAPASRPAPAISTERAYPGQYQPYRPVARISAPGQQSTTNNPRQQQQRSTGDSLFESFGSEANAAPTTRAQQRKQTEHWAAKLASEISDSSKTPP
jgi:hypothetical protein